MNKVGIDIGHGGNDPGAVGNGYTEASLALRIGLAMGKELQRHGVHVEYTRTGNVTKSLQSRTTHLNNTKVDLVISLHLNSYSTITANGFESFIYSGTRQKNTVRLQEVVHNKVMSYYKKHDIRDRGKKQANFHMLRETMSPALLIENLFISNKKEADIVNKYAEDIGKVTAEGVLSYLGISLKGGNTNVANNSGSGVNSIRKGDKVVLKNSVERYSTGEYIHPRWRGKEYTVGRVDSGGVILLQEITSKVYIKDVYKK